ncbi:MAG: hypothetical protein ACXACI_15425 [Candidatus Hodarchaeales archaeon]|jgi:hypothetical protein
MKVFHVQGKKLKPMKEPYTFLNGDVYLIDASDLPKKKVFVWLGSKAYADDRAVGAWAAKVLDTKDPDIDIDSEVEGRESSDFKEVIGSFTVKEGDTPGFLKHIDTSKKITYNLFHVYDADLTDGSSSDDIEIKPVSLSRSSLKSDDVYVLDGGNDIYVWIGKNCQVGEKAAGNRLARKLDVERKRTPMVYAVNEGEEPKGFFEMLETAAREAPKAGKTETPEIHKAEDVKPKKKGFFARLFGRG